MLKVTEGLW